MMSKFVCLLRRLTRIRWHCNQIGLLFKPRWSSDTAILLSEVTTRLPARMMHQYASCILDTLKPSMYASASPSSKQLHIVWLNSVSLLDSYSSHTYISLDGTQQEPPLRYLRTVGSLPKVLIAICTRVNRIADISTERQAQFKGLLRRISYQQLRPHFWLYCPMALVQLLQRLSCCLRLRSYSQLLRN